MVGGLAGFLAEWMVGDIRTGCATSVFIGLVGALLGGWLCVFLHYSIGAGLINDISTSALGALVLLLLVKFVRWG
jgi:uncharacterized membrane protein YeaQ/YmgE (transglycosylase-associated protein family)